jgi:AbiU2
MKLSCVKFEEYFHDYRKYFREEVLRFHEVVSVYKQIYELKSIDEQALNLAPNFFRVIEGSLFTSIILWADKIFDKEGQRGLFNFLMLIEYNRNWLSIKELKRRKNYPEGHWMLENREQITLNSIEADREKIRNLSALRSFKERRDKFHGHFDKEYFFDRTRLGTEFPLSLADLDEAGTIMGGIVNKYSSGFDGVAFVWEVQGIDDFDNFIELSKCGYKNEN